MRSQMQNAFTFFIFFLIFFCYTASAKLADESKKKKKKKKNPSSLFFGRLSLSRRNTGPQTPPASLKTPAYEKHMRPPLPTISRRQISADCFLFPGFWILTRAPSSGGQIDM